MSKELDTLSVNSIRILSADAIQKANSGHPGLPLGAAPAAFTLWSRFLNANPANPKWENRDRFILSGGHGSMLLYSLLHLFGYGLTVEDLKNFRQLNSLTPGHPEYGHTVGVEATTGPLGAGLGMAVGMAVAEKHLAATFNREGYDVVDHYTYAIAGDGCMMEGISSEAMSLAGTLKLSKLIVLYDSNNISIEGSTDIAFTENVRKRFEAFGFQTLLVEDGNDVDAIAAAIEEAKADTERPSLIEIKTKIGAGCPAKEGKSSAHGEPLGEDNIAALRENLNWPLKESFAVPQEVYDYIKELTKKSQAAEDEWNALFADYAAKFPELKEKWDAYFGDSDAASKLYDIPEFAKAQEKPTASRNASGEVINILKDAIPNLIGGSADLSPSTKTYMNGAGDFSAATPEGRNMHYGVRELSMAAIGNGITLHGGLKTFVSTFFVFSDYLKPMARMSALMKIPTTFVLTHDSIGVGEDGPTHQPIEQLATFRTIPNLLTFRPADYSETAAAWYTAMNSKDRPVAIVLSRQNLDSLPAGVGKNSCKGAYVAYDSEGTPDAIIIATGSEVGIAKQAKDTLDAKGIKTRVVSMPCMELFDEQSDAYKEEVLPAAVTNRVSVEAASTFGWDRYASKHVGIDTFGASGPAGELFKLFGITADAIVEALS
ncbi:transketolase [Lachnospiraceae bacterium]|nr:transketolase [Lachnospiraceae bacterium]